VIAAVIVLAVAIFGQNFRIDIGAPPSGFSGGDLRGFFMLIVISFEVPFLITAAILVVIYLLDCLYAERRDRSVLFWKSLPVSDRAVVLSKLTIGMLVTPLLFFACAAVTTLLVSAALGARGWLGLQLLGSIGPLWNTADWFAAQGLILYGMLATLLWYAPYAAYLLMVSAWARRSVFAWAFVPPVALAIIERLLFDTSYIGRLLQGGFRELLGIAFRLNQQLELTFGEVLRAPRGPRGGGFQPRIDPTDLLASPQLWIGLIAAALMVWVAIRLRQRGEDG